MNKFEAIVRLTRIEHSAMLAIAVIAAEIIAGALPGAPVLVLSLVTPIFISMGAFALNDYFDVEADTVNKIRRPLVVGAMSEKDALAIGMITLLIGVAASALINNLALIVAIIFAFVAIIYSYKLKDTPLIGNVLIALSMAIPFIYGNLVVVNVVLPSIVMIATVVFLSGLAREIHGMIRDHVGDVKARRTKNIVRQLGIKRASYAALVFYIEAIAISIYMFFVTAPFAHNAVYLIPILLVDAALLYVALGYLGRPSREFFDSARNISLVAMAASILVFITATFVYIGI